ncbi:MAG: hypothetical protein EOM68_19690 [Spirochaetia bacterium]|nr:hypothetical protein [Spirochaetia bacterium]
MQIRDGREAMMILGTSVEGIISVLGYGMGRLMDGILAFYAKCTDDDSPSPPSKRQMKKERRREQKGRQRKETTNGNDGNTGI